ncbi:adenylate/guanylate cyclase domain-containing protein [Solirubrobacter phytolaccae]|uniref:Adenylate/guanylate cyclase domain-containing protein n=1 Tax=Solirubrobacter phytolaccae TaxID=1404360 RepID=A0A9X3SCX9_9ACTN|nr:adenylate/guanylate cyclase domain-containing protein [Solirubrobacter phytolaccae]MDA0183020.1 adenylate/guanylate cyclase domain-containing protein [Solirubrobacter phytolaccae]
MHKDLRELLHSAEGQSRHVVVIFLDVRGFSSFAKIAESSDAAEFLRSVYTQIVDDYFVEPEFFKLTGDGMLILYRYDRESLIDVVNTAVETSLRLVTDFGGLCAEDPMVNFEVPGNLGIGIARGAATALISGEKVLDYSGRPLNLAARLMDLGRPSGVVIDEGIRIELLRDDLSEQFTQESVYVKGIAEADAVGVYVDKRVDIPVFNRHPIDRFHQFTEDQVERTLVQLAEWGDFSFPLTHEPAVKDKIQVFVNAPKPTKSGGRSKTGVYNWTFTAQYDFRVQTHYAKVNFVEIRELAAEQGIKRTWPIHLTIEYPIRPSLENG